MAQLEERHVRGWDVLRLSTDALSADIIPGARRNDYVLDPPGRRRGAAVVNTLGSASTRELRLIAGYVEAQMIDSLAGGWQTLFPNGGESAFVHGVDWGDDGEARVTWLDWEFTGSSLQMSGRLIRSPFEITKIVSMRDREVTVGETVRNVGRERIETMWGSQLMLGGELLGPETIVDAAAAVVRPDPHISTAASYDDLMPWPRSHGADSMINLRTAAGVRNRVTRLAYLTEFSRPWIRWPGRPSASAVDLEWDIDCFPYVWYSMEAGGRGGFPWYRTGYFLSLTPCSSWPAHGVHDARRGSDSTVWIDPGEILTSYVTLRVDR